MSIGFLRRKRRADDVIVDEVTGTFNRRQLDLTIAAGVDMPGESTATLMVDIDNFEQYFSRRDVTVEQILERVAWVLTGTVRTSDIVYRSTGASFCVLLPATTDDDAFIVAERIRANIEKTPLLTDFGVTVTVGVAFGEAGQLSHMVERADAAMTAGHLAGGNQVVRDSYS